MEFKHKILSISGIIFSLFFISIQAKTPMKFGTWPSPISEQDVARANINLGSMKIDPAVANSVYWTQSDPQTGANQIMRFFQGKISACLANNFSASSDVMNGGGEFSVLNGSIYFANGMDGLFYQLNHCGGTPIAITEKDDPKLADCAIDSMRHKLYCVAQASGNPYPKNYLVNLDLTSHKIAVLSQGHDFYSSPVLSPDHNKLAWLTWDFPKMPWDQSILWRANLNQNGELTKITALMNKNNVSVFQPAWSPNNLLYFVADQTGWWNIYRDNQGKIEAIYPSQKEFGVAAQNFGLSTYAFINSHQLVTSYLAQGVVYLGILNIDQHKLENLALKENEYAEINSDSDKAYFFAGNATKKVSVMQYNYATKKLSNLENLSIKMPDASYISVAKQINYLADHQRIYANYYAPRNPKFTGLKNEKPPLIVLVHGGPVNRAFNAFDIDTQYWTSRGYAILDLNYLGSTGFGRAYRQAILHHWGIVDRDAAIAGAEFLVNSGWVNPKKLIIRGESAGGYTVLRTMTTSKLFQIGSDYFAWTDLRSAYQTTHKFESHFLDDLIGPYASSAALYHERSPLFFAKDLSGTLLIFQGALDPVVPAAESKAMYEAAKKHGKNVVYTEFKDEGHGFRKASSIIKCLKIENRVFQHPRP